jgi:hypothetical protein
VESRRAKLTGKCRERSKPTAALRYTAAQFVVAMDTKLIDDLILLAATAALSGFVVPYILKTIEQNRADHEKIREDQRARHEKLVDAQANFLDRLTEKLWKWRYLTIRLTYYGGIPGSDKYAESKEAYSEGFWSILNDIRVEISKSRRLVSESVVKELQAFYGQIVKLDRELLAIAAEKDEVQRYILYMDLNYKVFLTVSNNIDLLLETVATDLCLTKKALHR